MSSATLKSIASVTGFSITTVSRALGGYNDVNEETRRLIVEEALRQGYTPNLHARALQGQRAQTLGFVIPASESRYSDPFFSQFVAGIGSQAAAASYDLLLSTHEAEPGELDVYHRMIAGSRVDGFILIRTRIDDPRIRYLLTTNVPFVVFGRSTETEPIIYLDTDGTTGQHLLTSHLIARGHRRIAYISPPAHLMFTRHRMAGFRVAMSAHDVPIDERCIIEATLTETGGRTAAERLLALPDPPTAIMAGSDLMAFGVMSVIQQHNLRIGRDVAVAGFDDIPAAAYVHPGLTTIRQSIFETARELTRLLLDRLDGRLPDPLGKLLMPELVIRASTVPPEHDR